MRIKDKLLENRALSQVKDPYESFENKVVKAFYLERAVMMKKNVKLCLRITSDLLDRLKAEAEEQEIALASLCRQKLNSLSKLNNIEFLILELNKKLISLEK